MRYRSHAAGIFLAIMALVATGLPVSAADPPAPIPAPLVMEGCTGDRLLAREPRLGREAVSQGVGQGQAQGLSPASDGSVRVSFGKSKATQAEVREIIRAAWEGMHRYRTFGFTAAAISKKNPLIIAIEPGDGFPYYSWKSGVVYISEGSAASLAGLDAGASLSARMELWHELFHWVQDEAYVMGLAAITGGDTWWMETSAEVATFLVDPAGAPRNARLYGRSTHGAGNVSQLAPYQWPTKELYQHGQRLLASMYASSPTMTASEFVQAVNAGTFIVHRNGWPQAFLAAIDEYAEYLLTGELPGFGTVGPIASGVWFGDFIGVVAEKNGKAGDGFRLLGNNHKPQIDRGTGTVEAVMQANSVYALTILSGSRYADWEGAYPPAKPAKVTIEPGPPFKFRLDGGPIVEHTGGSELVIEPFIEGSGVGEIRIVAVAKDAGATFRARIEPLEADPGGTAQLVHTLANLDPGEQGASELVCTYDGSATLTLDGGMWSVVYTGEDWHGLDGAKFVCGGGTGGAILGRGSYTTDPLAFTLESSCDRDVFLFDGTTLTGATYGYCGDNDVYTWEVTVDTLAP